ncbi:hypothetical protein Athai_15560 [Actinocatenispora thailandica]|uniref:ABC transporter domain-containing protein n=1 Tax=Actinocatenispora thailandica TaxID=227318 RepID=A0A7R7HVQ0_9ACTN|nr:ATP-binding cassette domain-containing protein [Actinocatenispora thailandica]BCJ34053.1 hypothetical protein Athai_15560 [Actinocatenispora thailandica]
MTVDSTDELLTVENLSLELDIGGQQLNALRDVSFSLRAGEARGLVGESGSGKSLTLRAILGLLPRTPASRRAGWWSPGRSST